VGCHRCGRRQVDPDSGPSAWRRAVAAGGQVLVCPDCQVDGWTDDLDRCRACGSTVLVRRLGEVSCRSCGAAGTAAWGPGSGGGAEVVATTASREQLAADVAAALDRVLRRAEG